MYEDLKSFNIHFIHLDATLNITHLEYRVLPPIFYFDYENFLFTYVVKHKHKSRILF